MTKMCPVLGIAAKMCLLLPLVVYIGCFYQSRDAFGDTALTPVSALRESVFKKDPGRDSRKLAKTHRRVCECTCRCSSALVSVQYVCVRVCVRADS